MSHDLILVIVGGLIGIAGSLLGAVVTHVFDSRRRAQDRLTALYELMGRQAAVEICLEPDRVQEIQQQYLQMADRSREDVKTHPQLLDLTIGYMQTTLADLERAKLQLEELKTEKDRLSEELEALKKEEDRLGKELSALKEQEAR